MLDDIGCSDSQGFMRWDIPPVFRAGILGFLMFVVFSPAMGQVQTPVPGIENVLARLQDGPGTVMGVPWLPVDTTPLVSATYRWDRSPAGKPLLIQVYFSDLARPFKWGPGNLSCSDPRTRNSAGIVDRVESLLSGLEYEIVRGLPSYSVQRDDGSWFAFIFPDEAIDVCGFLRNFLRGFLFFEDRLKGQGMESYFPAVIGNQSGVM